MAEAHQAVAFQFSVTEEGQLKFNYNLDGVKLLLQSVWLSARQRYIQFRNALLKGVFPASPVSLLMITSLLVAFRYSGRFDVVGLCDYYVSLIPLTDTFGSTARWVCLLCFISLVLWVLLASCLQQLLKLLLMYHGYMFEQHGHTSLLTVTWQILVRLVSSQAIGKPKLYSYQRSLPSLPVPSLKETCRRYLESVKALLSDEEYKEMEKLVEEFQNTCGRKLQGYLWLKSWWSTNYVTDWWTQYVYLAGRESIMINSNYYATDCRVLLTNLPAARIAMLTSCGFKLKYQIKTGSLKPLIGQGLVPLCSTQYKDLFGTTRIPGKKMDKLQLSDTNHVAAYYKGRWYTVSTTFHNKPLSLRELEQQFQYILDDECEVSPGEENIMALTSLKRNEWADHRENFFSAGKNKASLSAIETAAFVIIFEDHNEVVPDGVDNDKMSSYCKDLLCGRGWTRWFDKSFSLICYPNSHIGMNAEHSWADAPIIGYLLEYCSVRENGIGFDEDGHCFGTTNADLPTPKRLSWDLSKECVQVINEAVKFAQEKISDVDLYLMEHTDFGKGFIKKCKISPDAFLQMALQLAYYKDSGMTKQCLTYEASMTRLFRDGRTETVRSATVESANFVRAMCNKDCPKEKQRELLCTATTKHQYMYRMAMIGKGIDRHLFCLYVVSRYCEIESPFLKKVLSEPWRLSTSQTPTQQLGKIDYNINPKRATSGGGFGPVAEDGYGVSYIIPGDYVFYFHISSYKSSPKTNSVRFANHIADSLKEMKALFEK